MLLRCSACGATGPAQAVHEFSVYRCSACGALNQIMDVSLTEWLGFNYRDYLSSILRAAKKERFKALAARDAAELARGKLGPDKVAALRKVMHDSFREGRSIRQIKDAIHKDVEVPDLETTNGQTIPAALREITIARTETTRIASKGSLMFYKGAGAEEYRWLAAVSDRTCPDCDALNGRVFSIGAGQVPPLHTYCRCTVTPVTRLDNGR